MRAQVKHRRSPAARVAHAAPGQSDRKAAGSGVGLSMFSKRGSKSTLVAASVFEMHAPR
jgi:hypothetical protein